MIGKHEETWEPNITQLKIQHEVQNQMYWNRSALNTVPYKFLDIKSKKVEETARRSIPET